MNFINRIQRAAHVKLMSALWTLFMVLLLVLSLLVVNLFVGNFGRWKKRA